MRTNTTPQYYMLNCDKVSQFFFFTEIILGSVQNTVTQIITNKRFYLSGLRKSPISLSALWGIYIKPLRRFVRWCLFRCHSSQRLNKLEHLIFLLWWMYRCFLLCFLSKIIDCTISLISCCKSFPIWAIGMASIAGIVICHPINNWLYKYLLLSGKPQNRIKSHSELLYN